MICGFSGSKQEIESIDATSRTLHVFPPVNRGGCCKSYTYQGDYNAQGEMHGEGVMTWDEADRYMPSMRDVSSYSGQWERGKAHGRGIYTHPNGVTYEGQWLEGKARGQGTYCRPAPVKKRLQVGDRVLALRKKGGRSPATVDIVKSSGYYVLAWDDGDTQDREKTSADMTMEELEMEYTGQWREDKQDGNGREVWRDLDKGTQSAYDGQYADGKKHGHGKVSWSNGDSYEGQFEYDVIHGAGRYTWKDGRVYEGGWANNLRMGKGRFDWKDGLWYEGEYLDGKRYGEGTYHFKDGREYEGQWHDGKQQGQGLYTTFLGEVRQGHFEEGRHKKWTDGGEESNLDPEPEGPAMLV